jgi:NDP-sugar pyrophosphorylase family protein
MNLGRKEMCALILAGGLGTRLRPITETIPKPLVEINGKPFLEYKINNVLNSGIKNIIICVGYLGKKIEDYFGDGKYFGADIKYSYEKELLGTAGAIKNAERLIDSDPFLVMNGDTYLELDLRKFLSCHNSFSITMAVTPSSNSLEQELVEIENNIITKFHKRNTPEHEAYLNKNKNPLINAGVYAINKEILKLIPSDINVSLEKEIFPKFIGRIKSFKYAGYFKDIANTQFCNELENYLGRINDNKK